MANEEQLAILKQGVDVWNKWREKTPTIKVNLTGADLRGANLSQANLDAADLRQANLRDANLRRAGLRKADLRKANLMNAELLRANLVDADLCEALMVGADLRGAKLIDADLRGAYLGNSNLVRADISNAKISKSNVYGISVWDIKGTFKEQEDLVITPMGTRAPITVDNIKVAQFIYLILNNKEIRDVINTVTTKAVLILGRFTTERKQILDDLREALRERGFVPILFDFEPSPQRDLTETIQLLANMANFVIADITEAKSIPQELSHIIPFLPSVPVQPILLASEKEYAMFEHWRSFKTVLPEFLYRDKRDLLDNLEAKILKPIETHQKDQNEVSVLRNRIKELEAKLGDNESK